MLASSSRTHDNRVEKQRRLGIFYTPQWLAEILVQWALEPGVGSVLDPSFGGCAFLEAAMERLVCLGAPTPHRLLFGFDVDRSAARFAEQLFAAGVPRQNLVFQDFLSDSATRRFQSFAAVVGNPPYVRHHYMSDVAIDRAQTLIKHAGFSLPRTAGAWAYFALLAAMYVRARGRLALILPGAALQAHYGRDLLAQLERSFGRVRILHVHERLFDETDEESVIVIAADRGGSSRLTYHRVRDAASLRAAVFNDSADMVVGAASEYKFSLLNRDAINAWQEVRQHPLLVELGRVAAIRIGVVTGANRFFVRPADDPLLRLKEVRSLAIVGSKRWLKRPAFGAHDLAALDDRGVGNRLIFIENKGRKGGQLRRAIEAAEEVGISSRFHCAKRDPWFRIVDDSLPDLFMPYMSGGAPFLTRNDSGATCTNAIHRVTFFDEHVKAASSVVASSFTTMFAFETELFGRHYGGGVLKIEPGAAVALSVLSWKGSRIFEALARRNSFDIDAAREYTDDRILKGLLGLSRAGVKALRAGEQALAAARNRLPPSIL